MEESINQPTEALEIATDTISELMYRQNLYPESTAERFAVAAVAGKKSIWLVSDNTPAIFDDTVTRADFTNLILEPIFKYRQNNQDIATLYQWTNYHAPFSPREMQLIEATMTLDKTVAFADQMRPASSSTDNGLRGEFLSGLIMAMAKAHSLGEAAASRRLSIAAANISGHLDLAHVERIPPLEFTNCIFENPVDLSHASIASLNFRGSQLPSLDCSGANIKGGVTLASYFRALGPVNFTGAKVGGLFKASGGQFRAMDNAPTGQALTLKRARLDNNLLCGENFVAEGLVNLTGLECRLDVTFRGAQLLNQPSHAAGIALLCNNTAIKGNLTITDSCSIIGSVYLRAASIGSNLEVSASTLQHPVHGTSADALTVQNSKISGSAILQYSSIAGRTTFENTQIGGNCNFTYLSAVNDSDFTSGPALELIHTNVGGNLLLREATLRGETTIRDCKIQGSVDASLADMESLNKAGHSEVLHLNNVAIGQDLKLHDGLTASGDISLHRTTTGGDLILTGGYFKNDLNITACEISGTLALDNPATPSTRIENNLSLAGTNTLRLADSPQSWPEEINLQGFQFSALSQDDQTDARDRLIWLKRSKAIESTAHNQLVQSLTKANKPIEAKLVAIDQARQDYWRKLHQIAAHKNPVGADPHPYVIKLRYAILWPLFAIGWLVYGGLLSYGFSFTRPLLAMLALLIIAAGILHKADAQGLIMPRSPLITLNDAFASCRPERGGRWTNCELTELPAFSPLLYTTDALLPFATLGQDGNWRPLEKPLTLNAPVPKCLQWAKPCFAIKWIPLSTPAGLLTSLTITLRLAGWGALLALAFYLLKAQHSKPLFHRRATD